MCYFDFIWTEVLSLYLFVFLLSIDSIKNAIRGIQQIHAKHQAYECKEYYTLHLTHFSLKVVSSLLIFPGY